MIDAGDPAQTWCARCWNAASARATAAGILAPYVVSIAFLQALLATPPGSRICALLVVHPAMRRRWSARLGLPLAEEDA
jgi:hypothetical protein